MADYTSPEWKAALRTTKPPRLFYTMDYTDGHVECFTTQEAQVAHLAQEDPGKVARVRIVTIPGKERHASPSRRLRASRKSP